MISQATSHEGYGAEELYAEFHRGQDLAAAATLTHTLAEQLEQLVHTRLLGYETVNAIPETEYLDLAGLSLVAHLQALKESEAAMNLAIFEKEVGRHIIGRAVIVRPIHRGDKPITEYYYSSGLVGTRKWEPREFMTHPSKAIGTVSKVNLKDSLIRIAPRKRSIAKRMDKGFWEAQVLGDKGEYLINVQFDD